MSAETQTSLDVPNPENAPAQVPAARAAAPENQDDRSIERKLDKTRAALEALKAGVKARSTPEAVMDKVRIAFYTDLAEAGVPASDYETRWTDVKTDIEGYVEAAKLGKINEMSEFQDLNTFVDARLDDMVALPESNQFGDILKKIQDIPGMSKIAPFLFPILIAWADDKDKKAGAETMSGTFMRQLAGTLDPVGAAKAQLAKENKEKEAAKRAAAAASATPAVTPGAPEAPVELEKNKEVNDFLDAMKIKRDDDKAKEDYKWLKDNCKKQEDIKTFAAKGLREGSKLDKIYKAIKGKMGKTVGDPKGGMSARLFDIHFQAFEDKDIEAIKKAIVDAKDNTADKMRAFLDALLTADGSKIADVVKAKLPPA